MWTTGGFFFPWELEGKLECFHTWKMGVRCAKRWFLCRVFWAGLAKQGAAEPKASRHGGMGAVVIRIVSKALLEAMFM